MLIQLVINSISERIQVADIKLNELEEIMGQHEYINRPVGNPLEMDFVAATRTLNFLARVLAVEKMRASSLLLALDMIIKEYKGPIIGRTDKEIQWHDLTTSPFVGEMAADHKNACQNLVLRAEMQEKRVQTQVSVVRPVCFRPSLH